MQQQGRLNFSSVGLPKSFNLFIFFNIVFLITNILKLSSKFRSNSAALTSAKIFDELIPKSFEKNVIQNDFAAIAYDTYYAKVMFMFSIEYRVYRWI